MSRIGLGKARSEKKNLILAKSQKKDQLPVLQLDHHNTHVHQGPQLLFSEMSFFIFIMHMTRIQ